MHLYFRNVNDAFEGLVAGFYRGTIPTHTAPSRVGEVIVVEEPMIVTYSHPRERVLFNQARDCNPFFHLFEALWMLAGRNDVESLAYYNSQMREYSDNGKTFHGAYGHRWRKRFGWDQLAGIKRELIDNPTSRRCVLSIWNSCFHDDNQPGGEEDMEMVLQGPAKDVPCNTHIYFLISDDDNGKHLNMTVCNRSNDLIWGMLGANVVHFSMLQEYLAACIGVDVGTYNQITNNLHAYVERWEPKKWLAEFAYIDYKHPSMFPSVPLVRNPELFDQECVAFVDGIDGDFQEPFLRQVAQPMCAAFRRHKRRAYLGDNNALTIIERVWANDWRTAGRNWLTRRKRIWEQKDSEARTHKV